MLFFKYFGVSRKCITAEKCSIVTNLVIFEEFRCGYKKNHTKPPSTTRVCSIRLALCCVCEDCCVHIM